MQIDYTFRVVLFVSCGFISQLVMSSPLRAQAQLPSLTIPYYEGAPVYGTAPSLSVPSPQRSPTYGDSDGLRSQPSRQRTPVYVTPQAGDFSLTVRTDLLTPFVNRESVESDNVATRVLEADVRGVQTTATTVRLRSSSSDSNARLNIVTIGNVSSNTVGYTSQAQVATVGNHTFNVTKPIFFNGRRFLTKRAYGSVQVNQQPQAVSTVASGLPLVGRIGERIAWNEVYRRMPASNSIVVRQVADDVLPQINSKIDAKLVGLNGQWSKLTQTINRITGSHSLNWSASSTDQSFSATTVNGDLTNRTADPSKQLLAELDTPEAAAVVLSEDGINDMLAQQPLGGLTLSDASLQQLMLTARSLDATDGLDVSRFRAIFQQQPEPLLFSLRLAQKRPIQILLEDGFFGLQLKFQILPKIGEPSQMQLMQIRLGGESGETGTWVVSVRDITIEPASRNELPDSWTKLIGTQAKQVSQNLPPTELSRQIDLRRFHEKLPILLIHRIQTENAQLRVSFRSTSISEPVAVGRPRIFGPGR